MGVSGGFSDARHGPPLMPGGGERALDRLLSPLTKIGSGGGGHYVKMIHNGIGHGMMSALCEAGN